MEQIIVAAYILSALAMIGLILIQQGKGADMGASFGSGGSQTLFGSSGGASFLSKVTAGLALLFFVIAFSLSIIAKNKLDSNVVVEAPAVVETVDVEQAGDIPTLEASAEESDVPTLDVPEANTNDVPAVPTENTSE